MMAGHEEKGGTMKVRKGWRFTSADGQTATGSCPEWARELAAKRPDMRVIRVIYVGNPRCPECVLGLH
jgi:hypothetical protein